MGGGKAMKPRLKARWRLFVKRHIVYILSDDVVI